MSNPIEKTFMSFKDYIGELEINYKRTSLEQFKIHSSKDVLDFVFLLFEKFIDDHEEFKVIHLNRSNTVKNIEHHSKGFAHASLVHIRTIVRKAILLNTEAVIICHNHPAGNLNPSQEDINVTKKIKEALALFDIKLLDHIILTRESHFSFADEGIL